MESRHLARHLHGEVVIDVCWSCHAMWFDQFESTQLTPDAVLSLFRQIHEHGTQPPRPLALSLRCPRCTTVLVPTHDIQKHARLHYFRCPDGHGRLITFMEFLREKSFVRPLSLPEIEQLRRSVTQVRCSSCGAAVSVERDAACPYCRAPLSILDAEAVDKALAALSEAEHRRSHPQAADVGQAFEALLAAYKRPAERAGTLWMRDLPTTGTTGEIVDLMVEGLRALFR
ncbi:MAG: hypothetical protein IT353_12200 [Gemmatimonadaceae bacterium]|nr:hypothetical protein [Gemmatimonadaceae bacterium]